MTECSILGASMENKAKNAGKVAIVLEGGSYRGQFTAGVIDVLLEHGVEVAACYGTSAGALNGLNYKSKQIGRANRVSLAFCNDSRYMGMQSLVQTGSMVGYDFMFNDVQDRIDPFDNDAYLANPMEMYACATDIVFGTAAYLPVRNATLDIEYIRASTSLPLVTQPVEIDGHFYLDGGVADSVPVEHALEDAGFDRAIVILTQDRNYVKGPYRNLTVARRVYAGYPYLLEGLETRHVRYNEQREHIWEYERAGKALVIAPEQPVDVGHVEHDPVKLLSLYLQGRQVAERRLDEIKAFA